MHELLNEQDIVSDVPSINKGPLLWVDKVRNDQLQPLDQDPSKSLVEGGI